MIYGLQMVNSSKDSDGLLLLIQNPHTDAINIFTLFKRYRNSNIVRERYRTMCLLPVGKGHNKKIKWPIKCKVNGWFYLKILKS